MIEPNKIDILTTTGVEALRQLIKYQYDVDIDFSAVRHVKTVKAGLGVGGIADDPWASVTIEALPDSGYCGSTSLDYRTCSTHLLGIDTFRFVLEIPTVPVKLEDVMDAMLTKYGVIIEVGDFGEGVTHVMAGDYGDYTVTTADSSLRFRGDWLFSFVAPGTVDLDASVPNSQDADMSKVATSQTPE